MFKNGDWVYWTPQYNHDGQRFGPVKIIDNHVDLHKYNCVAVSIRKMCLTNFKYAVPPDKEWFELDAP